MWLPSLMAHTVWTECGKPATPPSPSPSTGATAYFLPSLGSRLHCCGDSASPASLSATSGQSCLASRATWLKPSAWVESTHSASTHSATPSLRLWEKYSAAYEWRFVRRCSGHKNNVHNGCQGNWCSFGLFYFYKRGQTLMGLGLIPIAFI